MSDNNEILIEFGLEATHLRSRRYAVSPKGQLGTCGWYPVAWTVQYVTARNEQDAVNKAIKNMRRI